MVAIVGCAVLLAGGLAFAWRWAEGEFAPPARAAALSVPEAAALSVPQAARRVAWHVALVVIAGTVSGVLTIGAGGRLAMRLLAVTSPDADGALTEAGEIVGRVTLDGTVSFVLLEGLFGGIMVGALYLLVRRALPGGRVGGIAFGLGILLLLGATIEPYRRQNTDFDIVGPGILSVGVFALLALVCGLVVHGVFIRVSSWLPLVSSEPRAFLRYAPAAPLLVLPPVAGAVVVGVVVTWAASRWTALVRAVRSPAWSVALRVVVVLAVSVAAPFTASSAFDIATR